MRAFLRRLRARLTPRIVRNVNRTAHPRKALLIYITAPFRTARNANVHQNQWQVRALAAILGEFGYDVDVLDFGTSRAKLRHAYDLVVDLHPGLTPLAPRHLAPGCRRIAYVTGSNPAFSNRAEEARLAAVFERRGARLQPRRRVPPFDRDLFESCDAMFFIGNAHNLRTYQEFNLERVFLIKNSGYPFDPTGFERKDPSNFLFFASQGQVHKGLDLLLEIFAAHPDWHLYVCSTFRQEEDFCAAYARELFETPNIHPMGFVDIASPAFRDLVSHCSYVVLPSCSEGQAGSVLTAMSAGLIPLVSRECGFEDGEVHHFPDCSLPVLSETLALHAQKSAAWIREEAERAIELTRTRYSPEAYAASVRSALQEVLHGV